MNNSFLSRQNIDKQQLSIFLRDLSKNLNVNLKHMIEDCVISKQKEKNTHGPNGQDFNNLSSCTLGLCFAASAASEPKCFHHPLSATCNEKSMHFI